ncbi:hypothetical protein [Desulfolithobacter sp.]
MKLKCFLTKLYIIAFMGLVVFFMVLIWNLTFAHLIHEYHSRKSGELAQTHTGEKKKKKNTFEQIILKSEKRVKNYLGYRVLEQQYIEGHFHHIGLDVAPDRYSYCSSCHGDMPHDSVKDIRAFLNMHAFFVGCQTCHVKPSPEQATGIYKWYDRETGKIVDSPVSGAHPGTYGAKIIPFVREDGVLVRIDSQDKIDFVNEYRKMERNLSEGQKSKAKKIIHQDISKKPIMCEECHRKQNPLLPLAALGYPKERIDSITSTEVVGMIKNYTKFYMPKMLHPGESTSSATEAQRVQPSASAESSEDHAVE